MTKIFKHFILGFVSLFVVQHFSLAQENNGILFEISGNGLKQKSYIFGTIHLIPKNKYYFPASWEKIVKSCNTLVLEMDLNIPIKSQIEMVQKMILENGKTLKDFMTENQYQEFRSYYLDTMQLSESKLDKYIRFKPVFFASAIFMEEMKHNGVKTETYEVKLNKIAKKQKMNFVPLETFEFQLSVLNNIPMNEQMLLFATNLESNYKSSLKEYYQLLDMYLKKDVDSLFLMMKKSSDFELFEKELITTRNHNWIPLIKKNISINSCFIAVGAGHLGGTLGVLNLLRKEGYKITPINE